MKLNKKRAFTLAEVLITLGVTGVLILLLVSSFRANSMTAWHKSNDYKTGIVKYDKVYNAINLSFTNQALKNAGFFKENKETVLNTALDSLNSTCSGSGCKFTGVSETTNSFRRQLADGTQLSVKVFADNNGNDGGLSDLSYIIYVDTNGDAKPNKIGQDRLPVYIDKNGNVLNVNPKTGKSYIAEAQKKYDGKSYHIPCPSDYEGEIIATKDAKTGLYNYDKTNCIPIVVNCTEDNAKKHFLKLLSQQGITSVNDSLIKISKSENIYKLKYDYNNKSYIANYTLSDDNACSTTLTQRDDCVPGGDYWPIYDIDDLNYIRKHLDCNFKLMNDIDLSSVSNWEPIGKWVSQYHPETLFTGIFDGQNYVIKNLTITNKVNRAGFFAYVSDATIKNVGVVNVNIIGGCYTGALVGEAYKNTTISHCYSTGKIDFYYHPTIGGGLIGGITNDGLVENSYSTVTVTAHGYNNNEGAGGLIGGADRRSIVKNCYATGNVTGENFNLHACAHIGGLVGDSYGGTITNCYASGTVSGNQDTGGLAGYLHEGTITNSYSTGNVIGKGSYGWQKVGGLVGYNGGIISYSYSTSNVNAPKDAVGGISGGYGKVITSYSTGVLKGLYVGGIIGYHGKIENSYSKGTMDGDMCSGVIAAIFINGSTDFFITNSYSVPSFSNCKDKTGITFYNNTTINSYFDNSNFEDIYYMQGLGSKIWKLIGDQGRTTEQMKTASTFEGWDTSIWDIKDGDYPKLKEVPENNPVRFLNGGENKGKEIWVWSSKFGRPVLKDNNEENH